MTDEQISKLSVKPLHFPSVLGGVVPTYNIAGITQDLKFTAETLSGISWHITKWDDARLAKDNPGVKLPRADSRLYIVRTQRDDVRFYRLPFQSQPRLEKQSGANTSVNWPVGLGGKGNEGVAGTVKQTPIR